VLLRARAIENSVYVIAAGQFGTAAPHYESWGHSMIVGPWGDVLDVLRDGEGHAIAEIDRAEIEAVRAKVPALANRRPAAYAWPEEAIVGG
jgi:predicted amidohydrolase